MARIDMQRQYDEAGSVSELARRLGVCHQTAKKRLRQHGVEIRRSGFTSPRRTAIRRGPSHHNWSGGTYRHADGYVYEYAPDHPSATSAKGYVLQHRLVMEAKLGRLLEPGELVHHVNEVKDDNRPENLQLFDRSAHIKMHKVDAPRDGHGRFTT